MVCSDSLLEGVLRSFNHKCIIGVPFILRELVVPVLATLKSNPSFSPGVPTPRSCFPIIIKEFDRDDSGDINYREFAAALKRYEVFILFSSLVM